MNPPMFEQKSSQDALTTASLPTIFIIYLIHSAAIVSHTLVFKFQSKSPEVIQDIHRSEDRYAPLVGWFGGKLRWYCVAGS
ncbi:hypothetical protein BDV35DRAFT_335928 [Aspergillus flavus]|uniref:Uncharacterized protein n=1 Tax=Aspergillus flavus TaxID=5059 RepID=A0A5N6HCN9_ASPFL|nr:hypothetical protein BDV35DRAFT_335928 [Aspergillus flavus]